MPPTMQARTVMLKMKPTTARGLSLFVLAAVAVGYLGDLAVGERARSLGIALGLLKISGLMGAIALFLSSFGQQAMAGDAMIDERQQRERDRAFTISHRFMVCTAIVAFFYTDLSDRLGLPLPADHRGAADLINVFVLLSMALPGAILAWQAPTNEDDDA
jgi:hypothetical protein